MRQALKNMLSGIGGKKKLTLLLCTVLLLTMGIGATVSYLMKETPTLVNLFLNGVNPAGNVIIQNSVSHPFGDTYPVPDDLVFTYEVDLGEDYAGETVNTSQGKATADENGVITVTVAPGGRVTIYDLDDGTTVTVTETNIGEGYTVAPASQTVAVEKYQDHILTYVNTYVPEKADTSALTVSGILTLNGRDWKVGDSFPFNLSVHKDGAWTSLGTQTVTYELVEVVEKEDPTDPTSPEITVLIPKPDFDKFDFNEIIQAFSFDKAGTYSFLVSALEGSDEEMTCDPVDCKFEILVGDADMDGSLEIQAITTPSANITVEDTAVRMSFENSYASGGTVATIEILKILEDTSGQNRSLAGFVFELYDEENTLVATSEPTITTGETLIRMNYAPADAGKTFIYVLKEVNGGQTLNAMTYDSAEYKLQVSIVDNQDGTVSAFVYDWQEPAVDDASTVTTDGSAVPDGTEPQTTDSTEPQADEQSEDVALEPAVIPEGATDVYKASFTNKYEPKEVTVDISGTKTLLGRSLRDGEFVFLMYQTDSLFNVSEQPLDSKWNVSGRFTFEMLTFDKVGTYYYLVVEDASASLGGVTYDKSSYLVTVVVTDVEGELNAAVSVNNGYGEEKNIAFTNSYVAKSVSKPLGGKVTLEGASLTDYSFSIKLYTADESFAPAATVFQTAATKDNGEFSFKDLEFTKAGTYCYVVEEDDFLAIDGMSYDDTVYQIKVVVTDPGDGQLVISEFIIMADGNVETDITFENIYVKPTKPTEPEETTSPVEPDETTSSTEPDETTSPVEPDETTSPVEPDETTSPVEPDETTSPVEPDETTSSTEPDETTSPVEPDETTSSTEPDETTSSTEPDETTAPSEPDETTSPVKPGESTPPSIEPGESTEPGNKPGAPGTGDNSHLTLWLGMLALSTVGLVLLLLEYRRRTRR